MYSQVRVRPVVYLILLLAILTLALMAAGFYATAVGAASHSDDEGRLTVSGYELLGTVDFQTGFQFAGTEVGGLSSITYDPNRKVYYTISDDQSQIDPARFYTLQVDLGDGSLDDGDISFLEVTTLLDENGEPFAPQSLDPEGIVLAQEGILYFSSEGNSIASPPIDPFINRINLNGRHTRALPVPDKFLPDGSTVGVRFNLGFESLTVTPDRKTLYTATEAALFQDGPAADVGQESLARILQYETGRKRPGHEYVYVVDPVADPPVPPNAFRVNGLVELLPIDNAGTQLAMERSFSVGVDNDVNLFEIQTQDASDVSGYFSLFDPVTGVPVDFEPVDKRFLLDVEDDLGIVPDNLEGMTFGPRLPDGRPLLIMVSDNNFSAFQTTQFIALALEVEAVPGD